MPRRLPGIDDFNRIKSDNRLITENSFTVNNDEDEYLLSEELRGGNHRLIELCFCSLAVTCTEVKTAENWQNPGQIGNYVINKDDLKTIKGALIDDEDELDYIQISHVPSNIAKVFWNELLGIKSFLFSKDDDSVDDEDIEIESIQKEDTEDNLTFRKGASDKTYSTMWNILSKRQSAQDYWKDFVSDEERKHFFETVESKKESNPILEKIQEESALTKGGIFSKTNGTYNSISLRNFFKETLTTIQSEPSYEDMLLLKDEYFRYIREALLRYNAIELVVEEKEIKGFIENQESHERLNNLTCLLDSYSVSVLKHFYTPITAYEYFKPKLSTRLENSNRKEKSFLSKHNSLKNPETGKDITNNKIEFKDVMISQRKSTFSSQKTEISTNKVILRNKGTINNDLSAPAHTKSIRCLIQKKQTDSSSLFEASYHRCMELMRLTVEDGGFAVCKKRLFRESNNDTNESFTSTFEIWNYCMAESCLKLYITDYTFSLRTSLIALNARKFNSEYERKVQLEQRTSNKDHTLAYVLKMLPTHLMRAKRMSEAIELLQTYDFLFSRMCILGAETGARQLRQDCEEIRLRYIKRNNGPNVKNARNWNDKSKCQDDAKRVIFGLFSSFKQHFLGTIASVNNDSKQIQGDIFFEIGKSFERMGWSTEALNFYETSLECRSQSSSPSPEAMVSTLTCISNILVSEGDHQEALVCLSKKLTLQKSLKHDISVVKTLKSMAIIHGILSEFKLSIFYYQRAILLAKDIIGDYRIDVYDLHNGLGLIYFCIEDYDKAIQCFVVTLRITEKHLDERHYQFVTADYNLGRCYYKLKKFREAVKHLSITVTWRQMNLESNHEDIARAQYFLGSAYACLENDKKNLKRAIACYEEALQITRFHHGSDHEEVARRLFELAPIYVRNGDDDKALNTKIQIVNILKINYGEKHESVVVALSELGWFLKRMGYHKEAVQTFSEVLDILMFQDERDAKTNESEGDLVNKVPLKNNADMLHKIGDTLAVLNSHDSALAYFRKAYKLRIKIHGEQHNDIAISQYKIGVTYFQLGEDEKALSYLNLALKNQRDLSQEDDEQIADTLYNLAQVYKNCFEYNKCISLLCDAHNIYKKLFSEKNAKVADTNYLMGIIFVNMGDYSSASSFFIDSLLTYEVLGFNKSHPDIVTNNVQWVKFLKDKLRQKVYEENKITMPEFPEEKRRASTVSEAA